MVKQDNLIQGREMKKLFLKVSLLCAASMMFIQTQASAQYYDETVVQVSLFDPIQIFPNDTTVKGVRLNFGYGNNENLYGLDLGPVNRVQVEMKGAQFGLVNYVEGEATGLQYGFVNYSGGDFAGWQYGAFNYVAGSGIGWQYGFMNWVEGDFTGLQTPAVVNYVNGDFKGWQGSFLANITEGSFTGFQSSWIYNYAGSMSGVQLGLINRTDNLYGVQIGLINLNGNEDPFGFLPIVNWSF